MNAQVLIDTAMALVAADKGLLAIDESNSTCNKRFAKLGIPQTEEARRTWRELILTTPDLSECISGVILYDETFRQQKKDGTPFVKVITDAGIIPGIKVDTGAKDMAGHPGEKITEGLDGLRDRLAEYAQMGACFAKWRAVFAVGGGIPSRGCIEANAQALARYASLCQEAGLVPIVEAEVLMNGAHTIEHYRQITEEVLLAVFNQLHTQKVALEGIILKPNMVLPGLTCPKQAVDEVADATVNSLLQAVPASVPGVAFLSGGQSGELASARLNAMNVRFKSHMPWALSFSFGRAIQYPALEIWSGHDANVKAAQQALLQRARCSRAALRGEYDVAMEMGSSRKSAPSAGTSAMASVRYRSKPGMRRKFIVGNWKMYTTTAEAMQLVKAVVDGIGIEDSVTIAVCPPFPYLGLVGEALKVSHVALGAQNLYPEKEGAFTGEVSPTMLLDLGCKYVILGHSERRHKLGESDMFINQKVLVALAAGLDVIFCVGETLDQREAKQTETVLDRQLIQGLADLSADMLTRLSIAYEPVWAIGSSGHQATPQQAQEEHTVIRRCFGQIFGEESAQALAILYGGSVNPENAAALFSQHGVDGVLIGADSLNADQFLAIVQAGIGVQQTEGESK